MSAFSFQESLTSSWLLGSFSSSHAVDHGLGKDVLSSYLADADTDEVYALSDDALFHP